MQTDYTSLVIHTKRLVLRAVSPLYSHDIFREFRPPVTAYMYPRPAEHLSETELFIRRSGENMRNGIEFVPVVLLPDGEFLGCGGLHDIATRTPELGIWLKLAAHGHRYGREAVTALKHWADAHLDYDYLRYPVAMQNSASRSIPEALGGSIAATYPKTSQSGAMWTCVEYHIPRARPVP